MNVLDSFNLNGKVALATGGAGLYGQHIVRALAEAGAKTLAADYDIEKQKEVAEAFRKKGLDVTAFQFDQAENESVAALLEQVVEKVGGVDVLVNSAVLHTMKDWNSSVADFERSMQINASGLFHMLQVFGNHMADRGHGSIINICSIQGIVGPDYTLYEGLDMIVPPDYYFHKGGMIQLTRFAAATLGPKSVRVNSISPGGYNPALKSEFVNRYSKRTFLGRMANGDDIKGAIVFLASDASQYVTGANIVVDGGYTVK